MADKKTQQIETRKKQPVVDASTVAITSHCSDIGRLPPYKKDTKTEMEKIETPITISRPNGRRPRKLVPVDEHGMTSDSSVSTAPPAVQEAKPDPQFLCDLIKAFLLKFETKTQRKETVFDKKLLIDTSKITLIKAKLPKDKQAEKENIFDTNGDKKQERKVVTQKTLFNRVVSKDYLKISKYIDMRFTMFPVETDPKKWKEYMNILSTTNWQFFEQYAKNKLLGSFYGQVYCENNIDYNFLSKDATNALLKENYTKIKINENKFYRNIFEHFGVLKKEKLDKLDDFASSVNDIRKALYEYDGTECNFLTAFFSPLCGADFSEHDDKLADYSSDSGVARKEWPNISEVAEICKDAMKRLVHLPHFGFIKHFLKHYCYTFNSSQDDDDDEDDEDYYSSRQSSTDSRVDEIRKEFIIFRVVVNCIKTQILFTIDKVIPEKLKIRKCDGFTDTGVFVKKFCGNGLTDADVRSIEDAVKEKVGFKYDLVHTKLNSTFLGDKACADDDEVLIGEMEEEDEDEILYREQKVEVDKRFCYKRDTSEFIESIEEPILFSGKCVMVKKEKIYSKEMFNDVFKIGNDTLFLSQRFDFNRWKQDASKVQVGKIVSFPHKSFGVVKMDDKNADSVVFNICPEIMYPAVEGEVYDPVKDGPLIKCIIDYADDLVGGDGDAEANVNYLLNTMAMKIQKPERKLCVAMIFQGGQGDGKDTFCDEVIRGIWAPQYRIVTDAQKDLFGDYTEVYNGSTIIKLEEINFMATASHLQTFKGDITCAQKTINPKFVRGYAIDSFHWFIGTCNGQIPVKIEDDDRRFCIFSSRGMMKKMGLNSKDDFWGEKRRQLSDPKNLAAFCRFLRARDISNFNPTKERPDTNIYKYGKLALRNPVYNYLENLVNLYMIPKELGKEIPKTMETGIYTIGATEFYLETISFLSRTSNIKLDSYTAHKFGRFIEKNIPREIIEKFKNSRNFYKVNIPALEKHLKDSVLWQGYERE